MILHPHFSYLPRRTVNVVRFRELSTVAQPEGVLQGIRFARWNLLFRFKSGLANKGRTCITSSAISVTGVTREEVRFSIRMIRGYGYDLRLISGWPPPLLFPQRDKHIILSLDRNKQRGKAVTRVATGNMISDALVVLLKQVLFRYHAKIVWAQTSHVIFLFVLKLWPSSCLVAGLTCLGLTLAVVPMFPPSSPKGQYTQLTIEQYNYTGILPDPNFSV